MTNADCARGLVSLVLVVTAASACGGSPGTGEVKGRLFVYGCNKEGDLGGRDSPVEYDLAPNFFAGEPLGDLRGGGFSENRLIIRLQSSGKQVEINDTLTFILRNSYEVARCVRGRKRTLATGGEAPDYDPNLCAPGPQGTGPVRLRVGPDFLVQANLAPRFTCPRNGNVVGTALGLAPKPTEPAPPAETWESWIELVHFGSATEGAEIKGDFKVDFGERVHAPNFHLTLTDDAILKAVKRNDVPPRSEISGALDGYFDFNLKRGQGYQTFP